MRDLSSYLMSDFLDLSAREVLQTSPGVLLGVTSDGVDILEALQINTVFDLATSRLFANAELLVQASADSTNYLARFGTVPSDVVDSSATSIPISELQYKSTDILRGISSAQAKDIETELNVKTVRDLAKWPPYVAAKNILQSEYFPEAVPGFDPEAPADLLPKSGEYPTERVFYETLLIDEIEEDPNQLEDIETAGPIDLLPAVNANFGFKKPAIGALLTFSQSWFAQGVALGQLLHSVALAPGESTRMAVYDWSRRTRGVRGETVTQTESLSNSTLHSRALSEVTDAVATEAQRGFSRTTSESTAKQGGGGLGFSWGPLTIGGSGSAATASTEATSFSSSFGRRAIAPEYTQKVVDRTQQNANSVRNRRASVVQEISQAEHETVSTRVITNYNHMHALSIQYYEVVQIYRVVVQLSEVKRLLYIPMKLVDFRKQEDNTNRFVFIEKYRQVLAQAAFDEAIRTMLTTEYGVVEVIPETPKVSIFDRPTVPAGNLVATAVDEEGDNSGIQPFLVTPIATTGTVANLRATAPVLNVIPIALSNAMNHEFSAG